MSLQIPGKTVNYLAKRTIHTDLWGVLYVLLCGPKGPTFLERPGGSLDVIVRPKATQVRRLLYSRVKELHHLNGRTPKCDIHKSMPGPEQKLYNCSVLHVSCSFKTL